MGLRVPPKCEATCFIHLSGAEPAQHQPTGIVIFMLGAADLVDVRQHRRDVVGETLLRLHVVERAVKRALRTRPVVADDIDDEGIVALSEGFQSRDELADLRVDVLEESCEHLLHPGVKAFFIRGGGVPGGNFRGPRREFCIGRDDTELLLIFEGDLALLVPAIIEFSLIFVRPSLRDVMRSMSGAGAQ